METAGIEPATGSVQASGALPRARPRECGRVESNHQSPRRRVYSPLSSPMLSIRTKGDRSGSNRRFGIHRPGCCRYTTVTKSGDDRIRTGGLSPDKRVLCSSELRPHLFPLFRKVRDPPASPP
jgi:hypothetical protein